MTTKIQLTLVITCAVLWDRYFADPSDKDVDRELREALKIPDDRYYSVAVWPVPGEVSLTLKRTPPVRKISKSTA